MYKLKDKYLYKIYASLQMSERNVIKMAILKKTAALLTAVMISVSICSCGADTAYALKADGKEIKAGVYIDYVFNEMSTQASNLGQQSSSDDVLNQKIDGKNFSDYVADEAMKSTKEYAAVNAKFDEFKLKLDESKTKDINSKVNDAWEQQGKLYEKEGISKESFKSVALNSLKRSAVFDYFYAKDGKEEVTDADLQKYVEDNYLRYKVIYMAKNADDSAADKETKDLRDSYIKKAEGLSFADFDKIIEEYNEYQQKKADESSAAQADSSAAESAADSSSADESKTDDSVTAESLESFEAEAKEDASTVSAKETSDEASSAADSSSDSKTDSESDPYKNEQMTNYSTLDEKTLEQSYGKALTKIKEMKNNVATAYEDDNAYYIFIKGDIKERSKTYASDEDNHDNILYEMKGDDFQKKIDDWVEKIKFDINDKAIKRYSVDEVYNIQKESNKSAK